MWAVQASKLGQDFSSEDLFISIKQVSVGGTKLVNWAGLFYPGFVHFN